jgi:hypothetical protein
MFPIRQQLTIKITFFFLNLSPHTKFSDHALTLQHRGIETTVCSTEGYLNFTQTDYKLPAF